MHASLDFELLKFETCVLLLVFMAAFLWLCLDGCILVTMFLVAVF